MKTPLTFIIPAMLLLLCGSVASGVGKTYVRTNAAALPEVGTDQTISTIQEKMNDGEVLTPGEQELLNRWEITHPQAHTNPAHLDDQDGPDAFGYAFMDNLNGDTATYSWIELRGDPGAAWISSWASYDDGCAGSSIPIGFSFPFYGANYTTVTPTSNGHVEFGTCNALHYTACMPYAGWGPAILPVMYDLHLQRGGYTTGNNVVGYKNFGNYFVIEYDSAGYQNATFTGSSLKLEVILYQNGRIKLQYNHMVYAGGAPMGTVGIQNAAATTYLQYRCYNSGNTVRPLSDGRAIWFGLYDGIPRPVTTFAGSAVGSTVTLHWTDPTQDTNGNVLTPDSILIYRGDTQPSSQIGHVAHGIQTIVITNEPQGNLTYYARAKAGAWMSNFVSTPVVVGNPSYFNDFETGNGGWTADVVWSWGTPGNGSAPQPHSGTHMWGTGMSANYGNSVCGHLDLNLGRAVSSADATLEFWYWYQIESSYDGCNVKVSVDDGLTWQVVAPQGGYPGSTNAANTCNPSETCWTNSTAQPWHYAVIPIGQYLGQVPIFRFTFGSNAATTYPGFFFDDMALWGLVPRPNGEPLPVTNFQGNANGTNTISFTWTDPNHDTNGNPLTPDSVLIFRGDAQPGSQIGHVAGGVQTVTLTNQPSGVAAYYARAKAGIYNSTATSTIVIVGSPGYGNNFDTNDGGWMATGVWTHGAPTNLNAPQPHSGTAYWGTGLSANYPGNACGILDLNPNLLVTSLTATLEFWAWWSTYSAFSQDGCNIRISVDNGDTWQILEPQNGYGSMIIPSNTCLPGDSAWSTTSNGWRYIVIPLNNYLNQVPQFRFTFGSYTTSPNTYPGFFFDDMTMWGLGPRPDGIPLPVTNLAGNSGGSTTVTLTWTDPSHDINGNPLTPDSILIYRGDDQPASQIGHVAGGVQTIAIPNEATGTFDYYVRAKHLQYLSLSSSLTIIVGSPSYINDFEADNGGWTADGVWSWGTPTFASAPLPHSGTQMWGTGMDANYHNRACGNLDLNPGLRVASPAATLEFWYSYQIETSYDGCNVKVSMDNGLTWQVVAPQGGYPGSTNSANTCNPSETCWTNSTAQPWRYAVIPIGQFMGEVPIFRFTFGSDAATTYPGFFFDDMIIWGLTPPEAIVGQVNHLGGANPPLAGTWVIAGSDSVQTDAQGHYVLRVDPGTYTVTFRHPSHCDSVVTGVTVQANESTTLNVFLNSPMASVSASSLTFLLHRYGTQQQTFTVSNPGFCPLIFAVSDTVSWLSESPEADTVAPDQSVTVTVTVSPQQLPVGEYSTTLSVSSVAPGSPFLIHVDMTVLIAGNEPDLPTAFALHANYPNPFNPVTVLPFDVSQTSQVDLIVYNLMGQEVARLISGVYAPGRYRATFKADDLPSGLYLVRMTAGDYMAVHKIMLLK